MFLDWRQIYLLSPELSLGILALALVIVDLVVKQKRVLPWVAAISLALPAGLTLALWLGGDTGMAFNRMLVVDKFALFFKLLFLGAAFLVILASQGFRAPLSGRTGEYYALLLFSTIGMMLMASTRELISLFISIELTSISLYILAGFLREPRSGEAGLKYLLLGAVASAVFLYGMALVFGLTGTTDLGEIAYKVKGLAIPRPLENSALLMGVVFLVAGFGFKVAAVPFHMWVPDVYEGAPTPITAYLSVASKAAGFAVLLRVFFTAFGVPQALVNDWGLLLAVLSALTMTLGNLMAIPQGNIKRMLAYSSIAHAGYVMVGVAAVGGAAGAGMLGRSAVLFYLTAYLATNLAAFTCVIAIAARVGSDQIADYAGMVKRAPFLAGALALALVSLTGIPPTAVFWSKIYIFNAGVQNNLLWLVLIAVVNSMVSAYYYLRVVRVMFFEAAPSEEVPPWKDSPWALRAALCLSTLGILFLGVLPTYLLRLVENIAASFP